jgi:hypothetical protein
MSEPGYRPSLLGLFFVEIFQGEEWSGKEVSTHKDVLRRIESQASPPATPSRGRPSSTATGGVLFSV